MKIGDGRKPFDLFGGSQTKLGPTLESTVESLSGAAGNVLRKEAAQTVDRFEKAAAPAFQALLGSASQAGAATADSGAALLGSLRSQLGRAESQTKALMQRIEDLRATGADGTNRGAGDPGKALLEGLAAVSDALSRAQDVIAAESTLESMIGRAGQLLRADTARDTQALGRALDGLKSAAAGSLEVGLTVAQRTVQMQAAEGREGLAELKRELADVESQIRLILVQIEKIRAAEAGEQDASEAGAGDDPLASVGESVSDAYEAIRDLFD